VRYPRCCGAEQAAAAATFQNVCASCIAEQGEPPTSFRQSIDFSRNAVSGVDCCRVHFGVREARTWTARIILLAAERANPRHINMAASIRFSGVVNKARLERQRSGWNPMLRNGRMISPHWGTLFPSDGKI
jgi:hypothetical protein